MRDSAALPGVTPAEVVSQLAYRVFGPLRPTRTQVVLDYHGLLAHPAGSAVDIARRHHVTPPTVTNNAAAVRVAGARQPLSPVVVAEAQRPSTQQDDHLGRVRIAATLGLSQPAAPAAVKAPTQNDNTIPAGDRAVARSAVRILAAVGPLPLPALAAAVTRARRFRDRNPMPDTQLVVALLQVGCTLDAAERWHPPAGTLPSGRDQLIVSKARDRHLTRKQMIHILLDAGYSIRSAEGRMSSSHPLFRHIGLDRYRLITDDPPAVRSDDIVYQTGPLDA